MYGNKLSFVAYEVWATNLVKRMVLNRSVVTAVMVTSPSKDSAAFTQKTSQANPSFLLSGLRSNGEPSEGTLIMQGADDFHPSSEGPTVGMSEINFLSYRTGWISRFLTFISLMLTGSLFCLSVTKRNGHLLCMSLPKKKSNWGRSALSVGKNILFIHSPM